MSLENCSSDSNIPKGWNELPLIEALSQLESGSRPRGGVHGIDMGIPSIGGEHLNDNGGFRFKNIKYVPNEFFNRMRRGIINHGDILIVKDGATTGKVSLVRTDFPYNPAVVNEHVYICRPKQGIYPEFLFYFLFSKNGQNRILENFQGSAQGGINQNFAKNTIIPIAPYHEQKKIVAQIEKLLARVDAAKERLDRVPAIMKQFRQSVLAAACSGRLTEDWRNNENLHFHNWCELLVKDILNEPMVNGRSVITAEEGFPVLRLSSVRKGKIDVNETKIGNWSKFDPYKFLIEKDDFFVVRGNGSLSLVGRGGLVDTNPDPIAFPDTLIRLRPKRELINPYWISYIWDSDVVRKQIEQLAHTTAGIFKVSQKDLSQIILYVPPIEEQNEIVRLVNILFTHSDQVVTQAKTARERVDTITQSILHQAFTGRLLPTNDVTES